MISWVVVQNLWREAFSEEIDDSDVLAVRRQCGSCGCTGICSNDSNRFSKSNKPE